MGFSPQVQRRLKQNLTRDKAEALLAALQRAKSTSARTVARLRYASHDDAVHVQSALDKAIASTQRTIANLNQNLEPSTASMTPKTTTGFVPLMPRKDDSLIH